jgi:hypothetical protein
MRSFYHGAGLLLLAASPAFCAEPLPSESLQDDGFVSMWSGKDLTGWVNVNCAPSTFFARGDEIITTGKPTGYLRTTKQYENFIAEFDWMHIPPKSGAVGNSGFFVWADPLPAVGTPYTRGIEVQVLVNLTYKNKKGEITATSQGDLFSIWGATCVPDRPHPDGWARCLPSESHCKGEREWNHYRVEANDGVLKLVVNGHFVSGLSKCSPRKGYLALESEGSECRFRNLKIKELPSTNPRKREIADEAKEYKNLYTGLDLSGWKAAEDAKKHWQPHDSVLHYDGKDSGEVISLRSNKDYLNGDLIIDFQFHENEGKGCVFAFGDATFSIAGDGSYTVAFRPNALHGGSKIPSLKPAGQWNRLHLILQDREVTITINGWDVTRRLTVAGDATAGPLVLTPAGAMDFENIFVREKK